jgi:precorrin-4/cobalt-precorrin-4 C11-methyltransferase
MKVFFVGAGPGAPELLTVRAEALLKNCRCCVYAGSLLSPGVIDLIPREAERHDSAKLSLNEIVEIFLDANQRGIDVIRLHSGDPAIYGAIGEQMRALERHGIVYEVVPGVSSFQAAAAALRLELTAPEVAQTVILTRASGRTPLPQKEELENLAKARATLCIFLSVHKIQDVTRTLSTHYGETCPVAVVYHASWPDQVTIRGTLSDIAEKTESAGITKTAVILVGRALANDAPGSKLYDPEFSHGHRKAEGR